MPAMPLHRFHCPSLSTGVVELPADEAKHASRVLRLTPGTRVELFDGHGRSAEGAIAAVTRAAVSVEVEAVAEHPPQPAPALHLLTAVPRAHRQQFLFEKAAELGVSAVHPLICTRSTVRPDADSAGKWQRYCLEAAKQCGSMHLTRVMPPRTFRESLELAEKGLGWLATPSADATSMRQAVEQSAAAQVAAVWIGPEGGFAPDELALAAASGLQPVSLGRQILRIETAAVAVAAGFALLTK